jgi:hypothetical protein
MVQRRAFCLVTSSFVARDEAVAIEDGVDRARSGRLDDGIFPDQYLADLRCSPGRMFLSDTDDRAFDLVGEFIGAAIGASGSFFEALACCDQSAWS